MQVLYQKPSFAKRIILILLVLTPIFILFGVFFNKGWLTRGFQQQIDYMVAEKKMRSLEFLSQITDKELIANPLGDAVQALNWDDPKFAPALVAKYPYICEIIFIDPKGSMKNLHSGLDESLHNRLLANIPQLIDSATAVYQADLDSLKYEINTTTLDNNQFRLFLLERTEGSLLIIENPTALKERFPQIIDKAMKENKVLYDYCFNNNPKIVDAELEFFDLEDNLIYTIGGKDHTFVLVEKYLDWSTYGVKIKQKIITENSSFASYYNWTFTGTIWTFALFILSSMFIILIAYLSPRLSGFSLKRDINSQK